MSESLSPTWPLPPIERKGYCWRNSQEGYICTLVAGHDGDHRAGLPDGTAAQTWKVA